MPSCGAPSSERSLARSAAASALRRSTGVEAGRLVGAEAGVRDADDERRPRGGVWLREARAILYCNSTGWLSPPRSNRRNSSSRVNGSYNIRT
eukprot:7385606-Prymnesium_polylepis.1